MSRSVSAQRVCQIVSEALKEDLENDKGQRLDVSAVFLSDEIKTAQVLSRRRAVLCGKDFAQEACKQVDETLQVSWLVDEGDWIGRNKVFLKITGRVQSILMAERTILNFLQLMCSIATKTRKLQERVKDFGVQILDTRKTIPTLRDIQKYATQIGGAKNHRFGLFDAILLKENHLLAAGGVIQAIELAHLKHPNYELIVEVENLSEFKQALSLAKENKVDRILVDNFSLDEIDEAQKLASGSCAVEVSGGITKKNIVAIAKTGVDYISLGTLTKNIKSTDLSMRIIE